MMGGYASYVWTSFFFMFLVLGWNVLYPVLARKKILQRFKS